MNDIVEDVNTQNDKIKFDGTENNDADEDDGLDLADFDFFGVEDESDSNFDEADMLDMINDLPTDDAPNLQENENDIKNEALIREQLENDENLESRTLGVKLPVNINNDENSEEISNDSDEE